MAKKNLSAKQSAVMDQLSFLIKKEFADSNEYDSEYWAVFKDRIEKTFLLVRGTKKHLRLYFPNQTDEDPRLLASNSNDRWKKSFPSMFVFPLNGNVYELVGFIRKLKKFSVIEEPQPLSIPSRSNLFETSAEKRVWLDSDVGGRGWEDRP